MCDLVGKIDRKARKPWITQEMIKKMDEQKTGKMLTTENEGSNIENLRTN